MSLRLGCSFGAWRPPGRFSGFGDAPSNGDELNAAMTQAVDDLRATYHAGQQKIDAAHGTGFFDYVTGASDTAAQVQANYNHIGIFITQLDTDLRDAVLSGQNAAGNPYTAEQWKQFALTVADDIQKQTGYSTDSSGWNIVANTYNATKDQVADPSLWPTWLKVAVSVGVLGVSFPVINLIAQVVKRVPSRSTTA